MAAGIEAEALYERDRPARMELEWLKKKLACSNEDRRGWVELEHPQISIRRQCALLGLSRASLYYEPVEESQEIFGRRGCSIGSTRGCR